MSHDTLNAFEQACYHAGCSFRHAWKAMLALLDCNYVLPTAIVIATAVFIFFCQ